MIPETYLVGASVFDGKTLWQDRAVRVHEDQPKIILRDEVPRDAGCLTLPGGTLLPGFVDLQVNGGGGKMLGDDPSVETLATIASAHASLGTRAFLPTLITDTPETTQKTIAAVEAAIAAGVPGILGLHLEGPHLDPRKAGAHNPRLIRPMDPVDLDLLLDAARRLPNLMVTVAPESVTLQGIRRLSDAGVTVSLGHTAASFDVARRAFSAGARAVTHLFNAMSQLGSREPGLVGATLSEGIKSGLIADGIHVHPAAIRLALDAMQGQESLFLISDAMASAGTDLPSFKLGDRDVRRVAGRLQLADGTLAGADLGLARAIEVMVRQVGDPLELALGRATSCPASLLRRPQGVGAWPRTVKDLIYLTDDYGVSAVDDLFSQRAVAQRPTLQDPP